MKMKIKSFLLGVILFMPLVIWAGNPRHYNHHDYEVSDIRRDNEQHVIAKTICDLVYDECTYYTFDAYGNLLKRSSDKAKFIFEYDKQGYLINEIEYNYPEEVKNMPEVEKYLVRQSSYKPGTVRATENYNTLPKADEELSIEEQVDRKVKKQLEKDGIKTPLQSIGEATVAASVAVTVGYFEEQRQAAERQDTIIKISVIGGIIILILSLVILNRRRAPTSTGNK